VDSERFEARVADARRALADGDVASAHDQLGSALALWRGDALADLAGPGLAGRMPILALWHRLP
jgi:hypothetical protein